MWLPDTKTLQTLWEKIGNVLFVEGLSAIPLQMGPVIYRIDAKHKCMCVHWPQSTRRWLACVQLSISSWKPTALLLRSTKMWYRLSNSWWRLANFSEIAHMCKQEKKINEGLQRKGKVLVMSYWSTGAERVDNGTALKRTKLDKFEIVPNGNIIL